jgi:formate-dependent phosphoribosylglycinamide formyltransferase (GAR transformylase)
MVKYFKLVSMQRRIRVHISPQVIFGVKLFLNGVEFVLPSVTVTPDNSSVNTLC